jgi:hypothetical protein
MERRPLDVLRWQRCLIDASGAATAQDVLDRLRRRLVEVAAEADGLPLAVRVETAGACPAHARIAARPQHWADEVRATALDAGAGNIWIEKVRLGTSLPIDLDAALQADGPLGELARWIDSLKADPELLATLVRAELADLSKKLPRELTEGPDALQFDEPGAARELLEEVRQMLVAGLSAGEGEK